MILMNIMGNGMAKGLFIYYYYYIIILFLFLGI